MPRACPWGARTPTSPKLSKNRNIKLAQRRALFWFGARDGVVVVGIPIYLRGAV